MDDDFFWDCRGCGRPADDCCCDDDDEEEGVFEEEDYYEPYCHRCRREPCDCSNLCDHCGIGVGHHFRKRADRPLLCGRCATNVRQHVEAPAFLWARCGRGTPRQRRLNRLHRHQRACSDCGVRRRSCDCIPF